jgi:hypothetical protein
VFLAVITFQSLGWRQLVQRLVAQTESDTRIVVPRSAFPWVARTPIDHWGMSALIALHEGRQPRKYLAFDDEAIAAMRDGRIWLGHDHTMPAKPAPQGFFDYRPLLKSFSGP